MPTKQSTVDFILDQFSAAAGVSARKMFGGYVLDCDGKVVGLICDDALFIKITEPGRKFVGKYYQEGHAYKGAKTSMVINEARIEDREWLGELIRITAESLPAPKQKRLKKSKK